MSIKKIGDISNLFLLACILFLISYSSIYIYKNSFVIHNTRYYSLFDDEMISMRYAEHIADGLGPQWNTNGEKVEGFSNPLWVYIMATIHLLPIPKAKISLVIQLLGLLILIVNLYYIKKIAQLLSDNNKFIVIASLLLVTLYLPLINWTLQGVEISLIILLTSSSFYLTIKNLNDDKFSSIQLILLAIAIWIRMDAILIYLCFVLFLYFYDKNHYRQILHSGLIFLFISLIVLFIWRIHYFGEWLPNTYYLKMTGYPFFSRFGKGIYVFLKYILFLTPLLFALPYYLYIKTKKIILLLPLSILSIFIVYSIYIGGDSWEWWMPVNRFIILGMPLFIILMVISIFEISKTISKKITILSGKQNYIFIVSVLFAFIFLNFNRFEYLKGELLLSKTFTVKDNSNAVILALQANKILKKDTRVGVVIAGVLPYFLERNCIDLLGKNDKAIARMPVLPNKNRSFLDYNPGHEKWNYNYSIGKLQPDAVLQLWKAPETAIPFLSKSYIVYNLNGFNIFLRKNSKMINWELIKKNIK